MHLLFPVPLADVDILWPRLANGFDLANKRCESSYSTGQLWQMCRSGNGFLMLAIADREIIMASIWRFESEYDRHLFRCVALYGKNMKSWLEPARDMITRIARENGAHYLIARGREGWLRIFPEASTRGKDYEVTI